MKIFLYSAGNLVRAMGISQYRTLPNDGGVEFRDGSAHYEWHGDWLVEQSRDEDSPGP